MRRWACEDGIGHGEYPIFLRYTGTGGFHALQNVPTDFLASQIMNWKLRYGQQLIYSYLKH
jgi:hypothetical protein